MRRLPDEHWTRPPASAPKFKMTPSAPPLGLDPPPEGYWLHITRQPFLFRVANLFASVSGLLLDTVVITTGLIAFIAILWHPAYTLILAGVVFAFGFVFHCVGSFQYNHGFFSVRHLLYCAFRLPVKNGLALLAAFYAALFVANSGWQPYLVCTVWGATFLATRKTSRFFFHYFFDRFLFGDGPIIPPGPPLRRNPRTLREPLR